MTSEVTIAAACTTEADAVIETHHERGLATPIQAHTLSNDGHTSSHVHQHMRCSRVSCAETK